MLLARALDATLEIATRSENAMMATTAHEASALQRPAMSEIDVFGLTHPGKVRETNADHFLIASFHRALRVHATSLAGGIGVQETESRGFLLPSPTGSAASPAQRRGA